MDNDSQNLGDTSPLDEQPAPSMKAAPSKAQFRSETIGRYKTLEILGEGGMGVVYRAQQTEPVKREVALKLIKLGMDTKQVIARFESERQALALMDHPNVAKVFDAGATEQGRPYFVMELVHGLPITEHCDRHKLSIDQRLDLFMKTCEAVQHAHQKGIIHRDIKPSNILVEYRDGQATPKIIDFGVAKATSQRLTEKTLFTEQGQMVGTPAYMSPEQAELSAQDIDTRSDIYSLGVLLYELLTGTLPFSAKFLQSAGFGEIQRIIRDQEPSKPSTRMTTGVFADLNQEYNNESASPEMAARMRRSDLHTLVKRIRGDLDWIVMKCLEKDRTRRYETASALALDVDRHVKNEPVLASPPSARYRLRKFARRNRTAVAAVTSVVVVLVVSVLVSAWFAFQATTERDRARSEERTAKSVTRLLLDTIESAIPDLATGRDVTLASIMDRLSRQLSVRVGTKPILEAEVQLTLGRTYLALKNYSRAGSHLQAALDFYQSEYGPEHPNTLNVRTAQASVLMGEGKYADAEVLVRQTYETMRHVMGDADPATIRAMKTLGVLLEKRGNRDEAIALYRRAIQETSSASPSTGAMENLASLLEKQGKLTQAEKLYRQVLERISGASWSEPVEISAALYPMIRWFKGNASFHFDPFQVNSHLGGNKHERAVIVVLKLIVVLTAKGEVLESEELLRFMRTSPQQYLATLANCRLAGLLADLSRYDEAEDKFRECIERLEELSPGTFGWTASAMTRFSEVLATQSRYLDAEVMMLKAYQKLLDDQDILPVLKETRLRETVERIVKLYHSWDAADPDKGYAGKAAEWRAKLPQAHESGPVNP